MGIEGISGSIKIISPEIQAKRNNGLGFGDVFSDFVKQVNQDELSSNKMVKDFTAGNGVELHEVMIASEKAKTSLELLMQIRNKAIDMYKELSKI
jgi:flagellar hook-basal body complex protein FliE